MVDDEQGFEISIREIRREPPRQGPQSALIVTDRGDIPLRYFAAPSPGVGVVLVGDAEGGWDSPGAGRLYPRLCAELPPAGVAVLRLRLRRPGQLAESVLDALSAVHFLQQEGADRVGLVGHGFGAAVAAQAATNADGVRALVTLGIQAEGLEAVNSLPRGCASLFIHGTEDARHAVRNSQRAYRLAPEPRYLRVFSGAGHGLDEVAEPLGLELRQWLALELTDADPTGAAAHGA